MLATTRQRERLELLADNGGSTIRCSTTATSPTRSGACTPTASMPGWSWLARQHFPIRSQRTKVHGTVCFVGMLSNEWIVKRAFIPIDYLPKGVRLSAYGGGDSSLPAPSATTLPRPHRETARSASDRLRPTVSKTSPKAHGDIDANRVAGKLVGLTSVSGASLKG